MKAPRRAGCEGYGGQPAGCRAWLTTHTSSHPLVYEEGPRQELR